MVTDLQRDLIQAAFRGLGQAERTFSTLTRDTLHFSQAPEYLLTVNVAEHLGQVSTRYLTWLEFQLPLACSTPRPHVANPPGRRRRGGRCDIFLCQAATKAPRAAFEIKRDVLSLNAVKPDLERILWMLNGGVEGNTLQFGAVMFSTMAESVHGRHVIRKRLDTFRDRLREWQRTLPGGRGKRLHIISGGVKTRPAGDHWAAVALVAERVDKRRLKAF